MAHHPQFPVSSLTQLLAVAVRFERQAAEGYGLVARNLTLLGETAGAALFQELAEEEQRHAAQVEAAFGADGEELLTPAQLAALPQDLLDGFAREEFELLISPYRALAAAVRREELAFSFYSQVSAFSEEPDVIQMAEKLAVEELEHASLFREARRRAYHVVRQEARALDCPDPRQLTNPAALSRAVWPHEQRLHLLLAEQAASQEGQRSLERALALSEALLERLQASVPKGSGFDLRPPTAMTDTAISSEESRLLRQAARAFDFYDQVFNRGSNEELMIYAQQLSQLSLERIEWIQRWALNEPAVSS